ncbi:FAD-binding protein [Streptomyces sp. NBC_01669]|uniref:FAD-binding protein n=1 Tax=Streptomyces sp. NBC_01669 TaxID=2975909 RepID=UPI0022535CA1|nr:FAD-binding protein [Streptomyces sp. NBC_01669]MCX4538085.1 FAD-binding protein [Streptomyces sp. NBC_01669]
MNGAFRPTSPFSRSPGASACAAWHGRLRSCPLSTRRGDDDLKPLVETAERLGVKAHYGMRIERLVVERDGRVCGVVARSYGGRVTVRARRGVVLATGGFT